jgi:uncharacterized protein YodC (DUF2158 family)
VIGVASASEFHDWREPPLRIGDVVRLNSGGPACLVVDVGERIVLSWHDAEGATQEAVLPAACVHRVAVAD